MSHEADVRLAMHHFSQDTLDILYSNTFAKIYSGQEHARDTALAAFALLLCLHEQLSQGSFLEAVAHMGKCRGTEVLLTDLLWACGGLVVVDSQRNAFRFVHSSAQDFLEAQPELAESSCDRLVALSCLNVCINGTSFGVKPELYPVEAFYHYGALYWAEHCSAVLLKGDDDTLSRLVEEFVLEDDEISLLFQGWLEDVRGCGESLPRDHKLKIKLPAATSPANTPIFVASVYGLAGLLNRIAHNPDLNWNQKNDQGQTGLYLACVFGREGIVRFFIDRSADVHASGGRHGIPLQAACYEGHIHVVRLLLEGGANPNLSGKFDSALQAAFRGGHEDIVLLLLDRKLNIDNQGTYNIYLEEAAQTGFVSVARYLQRKYSLSFAKSGSGQRRALESAIFKGQRPIVERLLRMTQDLRDVLPADAVAAAALGGQKEMVSLLLDKGLDIGTIGPFGTPLRAASLLGHESIVRLLLNRAADVNVSGPFGSALHAAAARGHTSIISLLLQHDADPNGKGGYYGTALQAAAYNGHLEAVKVLFNAGADAYREGISEDAFHAAAEGGQEQVVQFFLDEEFESATLAPEPMARTVRMAEPSVYKNLLRDASPSRAVQKALSNFDQPGR